ncbi:hypothetical protein GGX14DRAFT_701210 [Mycena pura]|uniref:Uncharacterized protein n=1 Tax=Mycena pura TaxID=153505 RepID=A0AAD6XZ20_9AGAR|nr:hypothetical protein GGX14DRAFT_701210 [Mycena pura]
MSNAQVTGFSLSRNDDPSLEYVLADIPFFCVGLTALAVFTFFIVMRRTNSLAIYLYISSIFAFGAAILDLTQILLRGATNADRGLALNTVSGIVNTREVGFALAFGFRYLYLWAFVGQRPRYEPRPSSDVAPLYSERDVHSASWERWGLLGFLLKYALLGAVVSIPILQIIWRIVTGNSPMYIAESTIQIAVSVLLIAKLLLNLFLTTVGPWWRPFLPYIVPIIALMISTGIGTGNVLFFKFSETTLGRFLQAVEVYSLIVSVLIFTFYKVPQYLPPTSVAARKRSSFFAGYPVLPEPEVSNVILIGPASAADRSGRVSPITRISSWISRRPQRPTSGELNSRNARDAEMGISKVQLIAPEAAEEVLSPRVQILEDKERPPPLPLALNTAGPRNVVPATLEVATPSSANRPYTGVSFASYYGMATNSRLTMPGITPGDGTRNTDSPVYGLDGIIPPSGSAAPESPILARRPSSPLIAPPSPLLAQQQRDSGNSFDELLRQQRELDKSIAALRIFSPTNTTVSLEPLAEPETKQSDRSVSMSSGNRSEFSLSIFPDPPVDRSSVLPDTLMRKGRDAPMPLRVGRRSRRQSRIPRSAVSTKDAEGLFVPASSAHASSGSAGTQYDVTSFIGDLTTPGPTNESKTSILDDVLEKPESENTESPVITPATSGSTVSLRPLLLSSAAPSITSLPPATGSSGLLTASAMPSGYEYPALKPLMLSSTTVPVVSSPLSAAASAGAAVRRTPGPSVFSGPRKPAASSRRGGERRMISVPRQLEEEVKEEAEAFEKPRRPPALKSDS